MASQAQIADVTARIRRVFADDPEYKGVTIVNIESWPGYKENRGVVVLDMDNGMTVRMDVEVYERDS